MPSLADVFAMDVRQAILGAGTHEESILYTPSGAAERTIKAIVDRKEYLEAHADHDGEHQHKIADLLVSMDATSGVAAASLGDTCKIDGDGAVWNVIKASRFQGAFWMLTVRRVVRVEFSQQDYRIQRR